MEQAPRGAVADWNAHPSAVVKNLPSGPLRKLAEHRWVHPRAYGENQTSSSGIQMKLVSTVTAERCSNPQLRALYWFFSQAYHRRPQCGLVPAGSRYNGSSRPSPTGTPAPGRLGAAVHTRLAGRARSRSCRRGPPPGHSPDQFRDDPRRSCFW
jgi:hypothetical protein